MSKNCKVKNKYTSIGGQALIEGIMMKGPQRTAMSCRLPDKSISTELIEIPSLREKSKIFRLPIIRGIIGFIDSMIQGYKTLMMSAERSGMNFEEEELSPFEKKLTKLFGDKLFSVIMGIAAVLGVLLAVGLFIYLPILLFNGLEALINLIAGRIVDISIYRALFEGVIKIAIFVLYIFLVSKMNDIKRVFKYHGAEHKTIFCYEAKLPLTVENVRKQSRFHPRCGTSFMIVMLLLSIFVSFMLSYLTPLDNNPIIWGIIKLLSIPIIMGLGYEFIKFAGKHDNAFIRICSAPGLWMQRLTTVEPDDDMIEVAIAALNAVDPEQENPFIHEKVIISDKVNSIEDATELDSIEEEQPITPEMIKASLSESISDIEYVPENEQTEQDDESVGSN